MKDKFGVELEVGHVVVYATKWGSTPALQKAVVLRLTENGKAKVLPDGQYWATKPTHIQMPDRVIVIGYDNLEEIEDRLWNYEDTRS